MTRFGFALVFVALAALGGCANVSRDANGNSSCSGWGCAGAVVRPTYGAVYTYGSYAPIDGVPGGYRYRKPTIQLGIEQNGWRIVTINGDDGYACSVDARSPHWCGRSNDAGFLPRRRF